MAVQEIAFSYLVRVAFKDSVRMAHPCMSEAEIVDHKITVHDLSKGALTVESPLGSWKHFSQNWWSQEFLILLIDATLDRCLE